MGSLSSRLTGAICCGGPRGSVRHVAGVLRGIWREAGSCGLGRVGLGRNLKQFPIQIVCHSRNMDEFGYEYSASSSRRLRFSTVVPRREEWAERIRDGGGNELLRTQVVLLEVEYVGEERTPVLTTNVPPVVHPALSSRLDGRDSTRDFVVGAHDLVEDEESSSRASKGQSVRGWLRMLLIWHHHPLRRYRVRSRDRAPDRTKNTPELQRTRRRR